MKTGPHVAELTGGTALSGGRYHCNVYLSAVLLAICYILIVGNRGRCVAFSSTQDVDRRSP